MRERTEVNLRHGCSKMLLALMHLSSSSKLQNGMTLLFPSKSQSYPISSDALAGFFSTVLITLFLATSQPVAAQSEPDGASEYTLPDASQAVLVVETPGDTGIRFGNADIYDARPLPITVPGATRLTIRRAASLNASPNEGAILTLTGPAEVDVIEPGASPKPLSFQDGRLTVFPSLEAAQAAGRYPVYGSKDDSKDGETTRRRIPLSSVVSEIPQTGQYSTFLDALKRAGLDDVQARAPFTIFAPTNAAFERLPADTLEALLAPAHRERLRQVLKFHIAPYVLRLNDMTSNGMISAYVLSESQLEIRRQGDEVVLRGQTDARLDGPAIQVETGVIYPIDAVLLPPAK